MRRATFFEEAPAQKVGRAIRSLRAAANTRPTLRACCLPATQGFPTRMCRRVFPQVRGAHDAAHHFRVSRLWYIADEQNFLGSERFAKLGGERVF